MADKTTVTTKFYVLLRCTLYNNRTSKKVQKFEACTVSIETWKPLCKFSKTVIAKIKSQARIKFRKELDCITFDLKRIEIQTFARTSI